MVVNGAKMLGALPLAEKQTGPCARGDDISLNYG